MCEQDISITIFNKEKQKLVQYSSSYDFNPKLIAKMLEPDVLPQITYQFFSNEDYQFIEKNTNLRAVSDQRSKDDRLS